MTVPRSALWFGAGPRDVCEVRIQEVVRVVPDRLPVTLTARDVCGVAVDVLAVYSSPWYGRIVRGTTVHTVVCGPTARHQSHPFHRVINRSLEDCVVRMPSLMAVRLNYGPSEIASPRRWLITEVLTTWNVGLVPHPILNDKPTSSVITTVML